MITDEPAVVARLARAMPHVLRELEGLVRDVPADEIDRGEQRQRATGVWSDELIHDRHTMMGVPLDQTGPPSRTRFPSS